MNASESIVRARARELPIGASCDSIAAVFATRSNLVVEAAPGAGKTSIVPLLLLEATPAGEIVVVQPRRLAARMAASWAARTLGESVGRKVGVQVRFETLRSVETRVTFMTEGVLLRRLRDDPRLERVAAVIFDEFHERHLDADVGLALVRRLQQTSRPELRIVAMSATLDGGPIAAWLEAERICSEGRSHPVEIEWSPGEQALERRVARALEQLIERGLDGHVLVFLPGLREIHRSVEACAAIVARAGLESWILHGDLGRDEQDRALAPGSARKLILATNVAETSVTIDGVVAVIDAGLARVAGFDASTGLPRLKLAPISRASAAQRAGRAGRTRPGICVRLYSRHDHDHRPAFDAPEVRRLDLAGPLLELAAAGVRELETFAWFESPAPAALALARSLLVRLGALELGGHLSGTGEAMLRFGVHPRLARLLVEGERAGVGDLAAAAAALLSERPLARPERGLARTTDADILDEIEWLQGQGRPSFVDPAALRPVARARDQFAAQLEAPRTMHRHERELALRRALLAAHPDRVAQVRIEGERRTLVFAFGASAELSPASGVVDSPWVVALRSEERREGTHRRALVHSACAIEPEWLLELPDVREDEQIAFDTHRERVVGESTIAYGKLVIERSELRSLDPQRVAELLFEAARAVGPARFCPPGVLEQLRARVAVAASFDESIAPLDDATIEQALRELCEGQRSFAELERANLIGRLRAQVDIDRLLPEHVVLAGGRRLPIHYERDRPAWVSSRLQDFFGMAEGPKLLGGKLALVMHLQAPNKHDVAVTTDLARFWTTHYPDLRKQLMRRYPRHDWPPDPLAARAPDPAGRRR